MTRQAAETKGRRSLKNRRTARTCPSPLPGSAYILGTDEAVERFDREHPSLTVPRLSDAPQTSPTGEHGEFQAPARGDRRLELETIDRDIEFLDDHDPAVLEQSRNRRVGETHQEYNDMKIGLVSFTHPTNRTEPGQEERFDISAALALAATVTAEFYFRSVAGMARSPTVACKIMPTTAFTNGVVKTGTVCSGSAESRNLPGKTDLSTDRLSGCDNMSDGTSGCLELRSELRSPWRRSSVMPCRVAPDCKYKSMPKSSHKKRRR